jgi:hypothetical protein
MWNDMQEACAYAGSHNAFNSDVFAALAAILAYYKVRGTEPHKMLSPTLLRTIDWALMDDAERAAVEKKNQKDET